MRYGCKKVEKLTGINFSTNSQQELLTVFIFTHPLTFTVTAMS